MKIKKILIIGAGPAGASCAFFLKLLDKDGTFIVDLIEKKNSVKYKIYHKMCGEAISAQAFNELKPLKPTNIIEEIKYIEEFYPKNVSLKNEYNGYVIDRPLFLKDIIEKFKNFGGNYKQRNCVGITNKEDSVLVNFSKGKKEVYDYVIAADGANSIIAKCLGLKGRKIRRFIQYIVNEKPDHTVLKFFYEKSYRGDYKWIFPNGETTKIGFPIVSNKIPKPDVKSKIINKQARVISFGLMDKYAVGRTLLIGDAASQTNPITKGGIRPAMVAGKMAAESILKEKPLSYEDKWKKSKFYSKIFYEAFMRLEEMDNNDLFDLSKSLISGKILKKYEDLLLAFELSDSAGW